MKKDPNYLDLQPQDLRKQKLIAIAKVCDLVCLFLMSDRIIYQGNFLKSYTDKIVEVLKKLF